MATASLDDIQEAPASGGTASLDDIVTPENLPSHDEFTATHLQHVQTTIGAAPPEGAWERLKQMILGNPHAPAGQTDTPIGRALGISYEAPSEPHTPTTDLPMARVTAAAPAHPDTVAGGIGKGAAEVAEGMTTVPNLLLAAGSGGIGMLGKVSSLLPRAVSLGFGVQMLRDAYDQFPEVKRAWQANNAPAVAEALTKLVASGALGAAAATHAISGSAKLSDITEKAEPVKAATESAEAGVEALNPEPKTAAPKTASLDDIAKTKPAEGETKDPNRRVSGSVNIPLNDQGRQEMADLAQKTAGQFTRINHAPNDRAGESAQIVGQASPQAQVVADEGLKPWALGEHEGQPVESEKGVIDGRIRETPDEAPPGQHEQSTEPGESFNDAKDRTVKQFMDQANTMQPGDKVLNIASGRTLRMVDAYLKNGAPEDGSIDVDHMTRDGDWHGTGDLFRVQNNGLEPVLNSEQPGIYYARHGATDWNGEQPSNTKEPAAEVPQNQQRDQRIPSVPPAYGREASIAVPGEQTKYPVRYAVRELADVQASHNPHSFEANPAYEYTNDRDYSRAGNAARVVKNAAPGTFDPTFLTTDSPTAEHGTPIIDANGNALGGNSRTMTLARVYERGGAEADAYREQLLNKAKQFGIDPAEVERFKKPVLVREMGGGVDAQRAITDFNKAAAAELTPEERAVSDGRRLSPETVAKIATNLEDVGEESTLAQALKGDNGADILNALVKDGVLTEQEKGGYLDDKGSLTPEAKARIAKALVGRLYDTPAEFRETTPAVRAKLERIAPQILRVEDRPEWSLTDKLREAVALAEDARVHKMPVEEAARQTVIGGDRRYSPEAIQIAQTLEQSPVKAAGAFRRYANDEALSREGAQAAFFKPPSREEAFADAFAPKVARAANAGERGAVNPDLYGATAVKKFAEEDVVPTAKRVASDLLETKDQILKVVAPTVRSESAMLTGLSLRQRMAQFARRYDQGSERLNTARKFFNKRSAAENFDFVDDIEHGLGRGRVPNAKNAELEPIARMMAGALDQRRREVQALGEGALENFYTFYFGHAFERPEAAGKFFDSFFKNRSLEGPKSFLKHREFPTYKEAMANGMKPISDNPVDLFLLKAREMDRYLLAHHALRDLAENGIAKRLARTEEERGQLPLAPLPEGPFKKEWLAKTKADLPANFVKIADPVGGGKWYAEEGAAQVVNNFLSPGLRARSGGARLLLGLNNVMNQANLGLSAFHLRAVTISSMANRAGLGFVKAMQGDAAGAAWHVLSSPAAPFVDYLKGSKLLQDWYKPGSQGAPIAAITDALMKGGGRAGQPADYRSQAIESMMKQWRRGNWIGAGVRSPFAAVEYMAKPLMEHLVPRMKLGAFADLAQHEMEKLGPGGTVEQTRAAMAQAWDHVENRLGEMTYDNLFWNRTFKDVMHLMVRSVGWNLGDLKEMSSAGGALKQLATGKRPSDPHGLGFVMGYAFTGAMIGAMMQYLHTGQGPQDLKDYFWPKREDGKRYVSAPYVKDAYQFARDLPGTMIHKTGPLVNTLAEMVTNKDYYDRPIRNLDDPFVKQLGQEAGFIGRQFLPFTVQESVGPQTKKAKQEAADSAAHPEHKLEHFLGVQPAPAALQPGYKPKKAGQLSR